MQVAFHKPPQVAEMRSVLDGAGVRGEEITQFGAERCISSASQDSRTVAELEAGAERIADRIDSALVRHYGAGSFTVVRTERGRAQGGRRAPAEGAPRDPHLVRGHAHLPGVPFRDGASASPP